MTNTERFSQAIHQIAGEVKSLGVPDELFASKAFVKIYEDPQAYLSPAMLLITQPDLTMHEKRILGYVMQRLPAEPLVTFLSAMADGVETGATDISVLDRAAFAPFNFGRQALLMHYSEPNVRAFLMRLVNMKAVSAARKTYIRDRVLTGQAKDEYRDYMETLGRQVPE